MKTISHNHYLSALLSFPGLQALLDGRVHLRALRPVDRSASLPHEFLDTASLVLLRLNLDFDRIGHDELVKLHISVLSNSVQSVEGVILDSRAPPWIEHDRMVAEVQIETRASSSQRHKSDRDANVGLQRPKDLQSL